MKKKILKLLPGTFFLMLACCGKTLSDVHHKADYTKYKIEQEKKQERKK